VALQLGLPDPLLNQLIEGVEIERLSILGLAFCLYWVILEGCNFVLELLVELS